MHVHTHFNTHTRTPARTHASKAENSCRCLSGFEATSDGFKSCKVVVFAGLSKGGQHTFFSAQIHCEASF